MALYVQLLLNAVQIGAVYVLFALGLTIIFGVMKIVNLAHGAFFTAAAILVAVVASALAGRAGMPPFLAYVAATAVAIAAVLVLGLALYHLSYERYLRDMTGSFILSIGILMLMEGAMAELFGGAPRVVPPLSERTIDILGARVTLQGAITSLVVLAIAAGVILLIKSTKLGKALRAATDDHEAAMLQGISYRRIARAGFLIGTLLAAVAGCIIAPLTFVTPYSGSDYLVRAFIIVIIGRLGSIPGTVLAGFLVALVNSLGGYYLDPTITTILLFVVVILVLIARPQGILGRVAR